MRELSRLLATIPPSVTLTANDRAKALQAAGEDIIALAGGDPDFDTPADVAEAGIAAIRAGRTHYPAPAKGSRPLLAAIAAKLARDNAVEVDPETDVVVTPGSKWALFIALAAVLNPGDEVLYLEPCWVSYPSMIRLAGGEPRPVTLPAEENFSLTSELLRAQLSPRSKALLVNNPNNPTGRVLTRPEVDAIVAVAQEADLYVISDEVYEKLIFDNRRHYSLAAEPGMAERTLTSNGLSKAFAMTGWRLGWLVGPTAAMRLAARMHSQAITSAATFSMDAAVAALTGPQDAVDAMCRAYQARRDFMVEALNEIEGIRCARPEGAFYLLPRFPAAGKNSLELAEALLAKAGIAATPGVAFGRNLDDCVRFSIATAMSELERAVERLRPVAADL
ncbi:MAG: pyridoxal phosphate-dependent aminotransferase [Candidatus Promineifilaceae bacterium]